MTVRTNETTVKSGRSFELNSFDWQQLAGPCRLAVDEEKALMLSVLRLIAYGNDAAHARDLGP